MGDKRSFGVRNKPEVSATAASIWLSLAVFSLGVLVLAFVAGLIW